MKAKGLLYLILLFVSITVRLIFYYFSPEGPFLDWIGKTELLYDIIYYGIVIGLLNLLKDRKWLIGLTWITLIDGVGLNFLKRIQDMFSLLPHHQYVLYQSIISIPPVVFYFCIFFVRKSPARVYFRSISLLSVISLICVICAVIFHFRISYPWMTRRGAITLIDTLLNLLLAGAVLSTRKLHRTEYANFME